MSSEAPAPSQSTRSTVLNHTIPPFYACYLLRSFSTAKGRQGRTYIGSTPDPPRRWRQHNGHVKGGAFKTRLGRPWEMEMIVYGFPSKLQALQFEWAWQNPHASRHLHFRPNPTSASYSTPSTATPLPPTALFPKNTLSNRPLTKVQVLQYMLTVPPWSQFDLKVMFFSKDADDWWGEALEKGAVVGTGKGRGKAGAKGKEKGWGDREKRITRVEITRWYDGVDGKRAERGKSGGRVLAPEGEEDETSGEDTDLMEQVKKIVVDDYDFARPQWGKWEALATSSTRHKCFICTQSISIESHLDFLLCTSSTSDATCSATFHLPCLATHFLSFPSSPSLPSRLLPTAGTCPSCKTKLHWQQLIRSSFRRSEASVGKGVGKVKGRRKKALADTPGKGKKGGGMNGKGSAREVENSTDDGSTEEEDEDVFAFSEVEEGEEESE